MTFSLNFFPHHHKDDPHFGPDSIAHYQEIYKILSHREDIGFVSMTQNRELLELCENLFRKFPHVRNFYHIGIGGSSLGPKMLIQSLGNSKDVKFTFIDNIDPDFVSTQLAGINPSNSLFFVVSKSGTTVETLCIFSIISTILCDQHGIGPSEFNKYFVFATDPVKSELLDMAREFDIACLPIPSNVGGRYSALGPAGLFPCLFAEISAPKLLHGATKIINRLDSSHGLSNSLVTLTAFLLLHKKNNKDQTVLMPYSSKIRDFSDWFVQLWAESLGKKINLDGKIVYEGLTPIAAFGATDQHSQLQLFTEGPQNKCFIIIEANHFQNDFSLEGRGVSSPTLQSLSSFSMSQLIKAELYGTLKALRDCQRPYCHIVVEKFDEEHMGKLIVFFETLTAMMGSALHINPFDQPGVESSKHYAREWLDNLGK